MKTKCVLIVLVLVLGNTASNELTCGRTSCAGPRFEQSSCCEGYICVSRKDPNARPGQMECVNLDDHLRIIPADEIVEKYKRLEEIEELEDRIKNLNSLLGIDELNENLKGLDFLEDVNKDEGSDFGSHELDLVEFWVHPKRPLNFREEEFHAKGHLHGFNNPIIIEGTRWVNVTE